ncbi:SF2_C_EcoAI-like domain containing protein [Candidatus Pelagibacterales bacterium]
MQSSKLLSNTSSWHELNKKLEEFTKSGQAKLAGDIFENLCKYFLKSAAQYQTKLKNVWLLKEVKEDLRRKLNLPSTDEGIDLIAETFDNKYWAIQSKYRSDPKDTLTVKGDLATFANLAFNNCKNISLGLVMTTADKPPLKTKLLKGVSFVTLESFLELDDNNLEGWNLIKAKTAHKTLIPKALLPKLHQVEAINKTIEHFKTKERGKVIMPCGTGKSLTAFWIAKELKAKSILIAVPSLALLQQTLKVWTREYLIAGIKPDWLCVCSDQTVSDDQDDFVSNIYDLGIDVTTDKNEIKKFLKSKSHIKVVFTTYQSGKVTAVGAKGFTFDLGIMDEAHKTVGLGTKPMAHLIHQKNIKIKHRLFMTATERLFRGDKEEYLSMDDPRDYGDLIYQLSFKEAIEAKPPIISDYKIITFGITEPEIEAVYNDNKFIQIKKEIDDIKAREFATALALRKAIKKLGIKNAISFHSSIRRANNFKVQQELISKVYPQYGKLKAFHVFGAMPANQRSTQMREFAESKGLMTNARCLTEGVDLPAIDCVVFTDPKKSKVDIVQAAGRALRLSPGKKFGYILIPLLIPKNENVLEAAKDTAFEEIVATIRALAIQDSRIIEYLRAVSSGIVPKGGSPVDGITKINVLTKVNEQEFNKSIQLKVWDRLAFGNWRSYEECKKHVQKLKFKNKKEWFLYTQSKDYPKDMPKSIDDVYKNEWEGTGIFLGYKTTRFGEFVSYDEAKKFARNKKIKSKAEWHILTKSKNFPDNIPKTPDQIYKEFEGWGKFLGTKNIRGKNNFLSYKDCKIYAKSLKLRTVKEWLNLKGRPENVPQKPKYFYKNEWEGWSIFLGVKIVSSKEKTKFYCTYLQAKKYAKSLKLKNVKEWIVFTKNKNFPAKIPKKPDRWFKNEWETWGIFLGTGTESPHKKKFLNFKKAKSILRKFKLKNEREWRVFTKTAVFKKLNIPVAADVHYKKQGWNGYVDFLGFNKKI